MGRKNSMILKAEPHSVSMYPEDWERADRLASKLHLESKSDVIRYCLKYVEDIEEGVNSKVDIDKVKATVESLYGLLNINVPMQIAPGTINQNHVDWGKFLDDYNRIRDYMHPKSEAEFERFQRNHINSFKSKAAVFPNMNDEEIYSYMRENYPRDW